MARLVAIDLPAGPAFVAAVTDCWDRGDAVVPLDPRWPDAERRRVLDAVAPTHVVGSDGMEPRTGGRPAVDGDALVIATSGTTGAPKAVVLTMAAMQAAVDITSEAIGTTDADRWLLVLPAAHIGGFGVVARSVLGGTPITALAGFDPAAVEVAVDHGASLVSMVPTMLARVDVDGFRVVLLGGSAIPADRPPNSIATYGMTETAGGVVYDGVPLPGVEVRIADDGEIMLRTPTLARGYRDGGGLSIVDGFLASGDVGRVLDGVLTVEGRKDDVIVTGGHKVWPQRVEAVLRMHPSVADVVVVGAPDPEWGEVVVAHVVAGGEVPSLDVLRGLVKEELPAHMAPQRIEIVDALEMTPSGKPRRRTGRRTP